MSKIIKKKILMIALYPIEKPQHGGQKRAKALFDFYKSTYEAAKFVGVYHRRFYKHHGLDDILIGQPDVIENIDTHPEAIELITGKAIDNDIHVRSFMAKLLMDYKPDVIHVEQIFAYLGLSVLLGELNLHPKLILGSQNIESRMKKAIYDELNVPKSISQPLVKQIANLEQEFSQKADLVVAVSEADAKAHQLLGAKHYIVVPNGIEKTAPTQKSINYWQTYKKANDIKQLVAFIGSGHPPNWIGFLEMVGLDTTFMPTESRLLLAGGIAEYFKTTYKFGAEDNKYQNFWARTLPLGFLSEEDLSGFLYESDALLLPITGGGGSNLKTAEAILSGKKIIATSYAFRGFEKYQNLPNIYLSDNPAEFKRLIVKALNTNYVERTPEQIRLAERVQWQYCLAPLLPRLKKLARPNPKEFIKHKLTKLKR